jgi:DUF4097 and DUF4098 domain-containing protein YvlB
VTNGRHRGSLFAGLLLILLGAVFLLHLFHPILGLGHLFRLYWPVLIILWGVAKLIDRLSVGRDGQTRAPILTGGEAALLTLIAIVISMFIFRDWIQEHYSNLEIDIPPFSERYSQTIAPAPRAIPAGTPVTIVTGRGNITVHASDGNELVVSATKSEPGSSESTARERMKNVDVQIETQGKGVRIHPTDQDSGGGWASVDLDVQVPKTSPLTIDATHGDVNVSGIGGNVDARSGNGDIQIHDAGGSVSATLEKGDARITGVHGDLRLNGRGDDVEIADVSGNADIDGAFVGSTTVRNVGKITHATSPWYEVTLAQMTGRAELDSSDLQISDVTGDAKILTHNKDISIENVGGKLEIYNSHGDIKAENAMPPRADVTITNDSGDVDVTLPANSGFELSAMSRSGDVESDFEMPSQKPASDNEEENGHLSGKFGAAGPKITITTSYGTIHLHKSK